jgi:polyhydroxyalkanoate synthase
MKMAGIKLDLSKIKVPVYLQSAKEDHIAPANSVFKSVNLFSGPVRFIIAGSGHIAGVINPPAAKKYQYWTNDARPATADDWFKGATQHPGSWWDDWQAWIAVQNGKPGGNEKTPARIPANALEDAPGSYVMLRLSAKPASPRAS